jgi:hypothetical protein
MLGPQEASYDQTSRNSATHEQASLKLPPIRSLDISPSRAEHQGVGPTFHTAEQEAQTGPSSDTHVPTPSQP